MIQAGANVAGANISGANVAGANVSGANFAGANIVSQGEVGEHGQKGAKGGKGEHVSDAQWITGMLFGGFVCSSYEFLCCRVLQVHLDRWVQSASLVLQ